MDIYEEVNPIQKIINEMIEKAKIESGKEYNLGMLIKDLEQYKDDYSKYVEFEDGTIPTDFMSWRGSYCELALGYTDEKDKVYVNTLYRKAFNANGSMYKGYKGGEFIMDLDTPIHKDNYGECGCYKIIGIKVKGDKIIICTREEKY